MNATLDTTGYTAHSIRSNFGYAETSYSLKIVSVMSSCLIVCRVKLRSGGEDGRSR